MKKIKHFSRVISLVLILIMVVNLTGGSLIVFADQTVYESGRKLYIGDLKLGDYLEEGAILYPDSSRGYGITFAHLFIDDDTMISLSESVTPQYTCPGKLKVVGITPNPFSKYVCDYEFQTYDESEYIQAINKKNSHVYVGDMKIGDIAGAGSTLHSTSSSGYYYFEVYLDGCKTAANENQHEWSPSAPVRLVSTEVYKLNHRILLMYFETFYDRGEVGTEAALNAALNSDDVIVLANNVELSDCFFVRDGREHILDLNGYTLSRKIEGKPATGHVFQVNKGSKLTIRDSSDDASGLITGGCAPNGGGAYIDGELVLEGGGISGNAADNGAGIFVRGGKVEIGRNVIIEQNNAKNGGGIYICENGSVGASCKIESNIAAENGGGIYNLGELELSKATVASNIGENSGAGVWSKGTATIKKSEIMQNINADNGGGILNCGEMTLSGNVISCNSVSSCGGGMMIDEGARTTFTDSNSIGENFAANGGGIFVKKGSVQITDVALEGNNASASGGALYLDSGTDVTLDNVTISGNSSTSNGGGIYAKGTLKLANSMVIGSKGGCGIYFDSGNNLTLENSTITGNAGGIYMNVGSIVLAGGKIFVYDNTLNLFINNITFRTFKKLKVTGEFYPDSMIGITPPTYAENVDLTDGFSDYNDRSPDNYFYSDNVNYRISPDEEYPEAMTVKRLVATASGYKVKVAIKVTNDADWWDEAYLYFYVKDDHGQGPGRYAGCSYNFKNKIDSGGDYFEYEYNCGTSFPYNVTFQTMFGTSGSWRGFEADVKVYINGVNTTSRHCVHDVYGVERKSTSIDIQPVKYPRPYIELEQKSEIDPNNEATKYIKITAVDQYGVAWKPRTKDNVRLVNQTNPKLDTCKIADDIGMKWMVDTTDETDHISEYTLTLLTGSEESEVTKNITVHFSYPLHLTVVVDKQVVLEKTGYSNDRIVIKNYPCKTGYYITGYKASGACFLGSNDDGTFEFQFSQQDITLTAQTKGISYKIVFEKNGDPLLNNADVDKYMGDKTLKYGVASALPNVYYERKGYKFVGWNTKPDGTGTKFANQEKVKNLTTIAKDVIHLYAQWEPLPSNTTASIFSQWRVAIWVGSVLAFFTLIGIVIYSVKTKKKKARRAEE